MPTINYNLTYELLPGSHGVLVEYKKVADPAWTQPTVEPNPTMALSYPLELETSETYYVRVTTQGPNCTPQRVMVTVVVPDGSRCCPAGYTLAEDSSYCYKEETMAPTIVTSGICLAQSQLIPQYSNSATYLYAPGFSPTLPFADVQTHIVSPYWQCADAVQLGPMNREGVWVDTDCNGTKDGLTVGQVLQISHTIDSLTARTVYVGMGGDNTFQLEVNGVLIADRTDGDPSAFNYWHIIPVQLVAGPNQFNFKAIGDGSVNDAFAAAIYDNTTGELMGATQDSDLNILFKTSTLIGDSIDIATCPGGWYLDTSGGSGAYVCRRIITSPYTLCP